jgi:hypothetical protein
LHVVLLYAGEAIQQDLLLVITEYFPNYSRDGCRIEPALAPVYIFEIFFLSFSIPKMASFDSSFDYMSLLHDITTQAASGTRSSDLPCSMEDANERRSTMTGSDYDDDEYSSFCSGSLSTSTSLTSLSSSSSSEGIPTRPSSSQGWNFDGAWDVGEPNHTPKPPSLAPHGVYVNDVYGDPAERGLTDSPVGLNTLNIILTELLPVSHCSVCGTTATRRNRGRLYALEPRSTDANTNSQNLYSSGTLFQ